MMVVIQHKPHSIEDFEAFVARPENSDRLFELIHGEIIEVSPGRTRNSEYGHKIAFAVRLFCLTQNLPCHTSGGDGAYRVGAHVVAPDFAYKRTAMSDAYPDPVAPEWAVEIISPTDKAAEIREKREIYRGAGILLWEIYPQSHSIDVYAPGQGARTAGIDHTLDAGNVLPGFQLAVRDIFNP